VNAADEADFAAFVAARSAALLSFAHVLTGDRYDAEDVVQTALAATALGWHRLRRKDNPEGYVRRAIVTTHLNRQRRRPWLERPTGEVPEPTRPGPATATGPSGRGGADDLDERDAMWRVLATLPPRQRAVLVLRYYEDLSEADIAEVLGCSRGTVKSQAAKALERLRQSLAPEEARS
jgi:RNA polymerase sigma-70 factor (sigma-E family)